MNARKAISAAKKLQIIFQAPRATICQYNACNASAGIREVISAPTPRPNSSLLFDRAGQSIKAPNPDMRCKSILNMDGILIDKQVLHSAHYQRK